MTRALILNVGSTTLKWSAIDVATEERLTYGEEPWGTTDRATEAARIAAIASQVHALTAVAHRIVHGGGAFQSAVRIDPSVRASLEEIVPLGPPHGAGALAAIDAVAAALPDVLQLAAFDTAFHATIPPEAVTYAIPYEWTERWGLRRHGFHGLSVSYAVERAGELLGTVPSRLIVMHLGSGSSVTAVRDGRSIDTTMGFTPCEGMTMATRSGSVDPGLLLHLMTDLGLDAATVRDALNHRSGLLGISGVSGDLRQVRRAAHAGSARASLAYAQLLVSGRRALGAMIASLGGVDGIVVTGGVGEHDAVLRADLLAPLSWAGVEIDAHANLWAVPDAAIGAGRRVSVLVIAAREDVAIARAIRPMLPASSASSTPPPPPVAMKTGRTSRPPGPR